MRTTARERAQERVLDYMGQYIPPFYAVHRTALLRTGTSLMPEGTSFEWQEIGHVVLHAGPGQGADSADPLRGARSQLRRSEHNTEVVTVLELQGCQIRGRARAFAEFLAIVPTAITRSRSGADRAFALESFPGHAAVPVAATFVDHRADFRVELERPDKGPNRDFGPTAVRRDAVLQPAVFRQLTEFEFLLHAMPAGSCSSKNWKAYCSSRNTAAHPPQRHRANDPEPSVEAVGVNAFNRRVVKRLAQPLATMG